jgi:Na+-translocating ferredoxin:NAD+ oxidoreductase RnfD subunit
MRYRGKHIFNPANFALVSLMLLSDHAWVSSGQWGSAAIGAFVLACLGFLVLTRARRAETTIAFIAFYCVMLFGRAIWLDDPFSIPLHQMQNGALLIFAFFMISDPKTTPNTAAGRILYAALVASVAYTIQFIYYQPNGPILALIMCAPMVPIIDALLHGRIYRWKQPADHQISPIKGVF